uniref:BED-type domain-containing protein n=1 Tax=Glossina brevipalpis TaxID=37001 RepID=A0A1A9W7Y8_9MUSC
MSSSENESIKDSDRGQRRTSLVWKYFDKISKSKIRCRICGHEQNYQCTTGNILRHLKNKHQLDATIKGLKDPKNIKRMQELDASCQISENSLKLATTAPYSIKRDHLFKREFRKREPPSLCENSLNESYEDKDEPVINFDYNELLNSTKKDNIILTQTAANTNKLKDDLIIAETEYFREKAAYFRMQKHLAALQAKKLKLELEELFAKYKMKS